MPRIKPVDKPEGKAKELLDAVQKKLGAQPNIFRTLAHSPAALEGFLNFSGALAGTQLSPAMREQVALTVAGINQCDYCASAHTVIGKKTGVSDAELTAAVAGKSADKKTQAGLSFVASLVKKHGAVATAEIDALRKAGYSEGEIVELVALTAINIYTNYFNHVAETEVDFLPKVETKKLASAA
jgi:uncharacterized peroxidase-related enzyme